MTITLEQCTGQQLAALEKVRHWYLHPSSKQIYRQFGFAGTGKTSLARLMVAQLDLPCVKYAAYTGKAAQVLRAKGCPDVSTIHSLIYQPSGASRKELDDLQIKLSATEDPAERKELAAAIAVEQARLARPHFTLRESSELEEASLLVLDEASMVNPQVGGDLESFGVPILVLGDPMQLPPVKGAGYFTDAAPDDLLTEVQRSEADSPVTHIATAVRQGEPVPSGMADNGRRRMMTRRDLLDFDQVIVGRKVTRWQIVRTIRRMRGLPDDRPAPGDRIMVLCNSAENAVFNGQQFEVHAVETSDIDRAYTLLVTSDEGLTRELNVWAKGFEGQVGEDALAASQAGRGKIAAATFAQAITCHKSQGSQWPRVLVIDEAGVFRDMARRWLYTAVTRASEQVVVAYPSAFNTQ